ncbi:type II toxin-antitoxin system RatA family toxin [Sphingomonas oligoaromativorans]|jgi:coenzyme Q-binding protein COQ10|uniref:type II toxin-antitoxin system RatA family toxin n=1 Tax=Sphingomonas oligoaromativorans TaxID=575322 RepID=UPI0014243D16|nr:type II toxin-antitoxin system RatA family toxin [Sphingomonas oligoaromativorans]NIJ34927.1 coenzyme Q-binding protein COQ10 [Sphingomonas oligoaromativorans]
MPRHAETRQLPYTPEQMFDLVADVARYGEFLPWVAAVRVREDSPTEMIADLVVGFKGISERFTSQVHKSRPSSIRVDYLEGPLAHLTNEWGFRPDGQGGTLVDFAVDFAFKSKLFEMLAGQVFDRALRKMIGAFETRAAELYASGGVESPNAAGEGVGSSSSSAHSAA